MKIASFNINNINRRFANLLHWLREAEPDIVCLQELKAAETEFPAEAIRQAGYHAVWRGERRWNGVAILSRVGLAEIVPGLPGAPGFPDPEARAISATCAGIRVHSVYVPNGREPDSDHYRYKLDWLAVLKQAVRSGPADAVVCGDMNIAPTDNDVFDPKAYVGQTHVTEPERAALAALRDTGLHDVVGRPLKYDRPFTYWDYRAGMFHKNMGMRIDRVYATAVVADAVTDAYVDRDARKGKGPSDHAPLVVDVDL